MTMAIKEKAPPVLPTVQQLEAELKREKYRGRYWKMLRGTVAVLVVVAATAVLISNLLLPILRIYGSSMTPTLEPRPPEAVTIRAAQPPIPASVSHNRFW